MKIMAVGAHPDDIELLCSGTLAKYKSLGWEVAIVVMTNGEVGSSILSKEEISTIRQAEMESAAKVIDAKTYWMGYPDEFLFNSKEVRYDLVNTIRNFQPDIILTHDKDGDYHPDHTTTGQIIWDIHVMTTVPNIVTHNHPSKKNPKIYYMDTIAGINSVPEYYVDISNFWNTKEQMIEAHKSQSDWLQTSFNINYVEFAKIQSSFRGIQSGCNYAESFTCPKFFPSEINPDGLLP